MKRNSKQRRRDTLKELSPNLLEFFVTATGATKAQQRKAIKDVTDVHGRYSGKTGQFYV